MDDMRHRILALCAGYGGLEKAVTAGLSGDVVAFAENDPYAAKVFSHHHPSAPNLGDITEVDWRAVTDEYRPDVITAGWPCTNISNAGDRTGLDGEHSKIWTNVNEAIGVVRPRLVFLENVAAVRRRGLDRVLGGLAGHGYDARWTCLRASETVDACHPRYRFFAVAWPSEDSDVPARDEWRSAATGETQSGGHGPTLEDEAVFLFPHSNGIGRNRGPRDVTQQERRGESADRGHATVPTPTQRDWKSGSSNLTERNGRPLNEWAVNTELDDRWVATNGKDYGPAVRGWERVMGREAPSPTEEGPRGGRALSPAFEEWMMGIPAGHVTGVPDIPRKEQMRMLGNGVVWQQAHYAYTYLLTSDDFTITEKDDMNDDAQAEIDASEETAQLEPKAEKPRGGCTGCAFDYQLGTARSGEFKGQLVIRKHNSRVGPGLCSGAGRPPRGAEDSSEEISDDGLNDLVGTASESPADPSPLLPMLATATGDVGTFVDPHASRYEQDDNPGTVVAVTFADPAPMPAEMPPVSGQPEPDRDRWGRYVLLGTSHTRATSFAKLGSSTYALAEWGERMLIKGLVQRPDLLALAHGLDVKRDRDALNKIADDAQTHAGNKVAANIGTAYHAFTERLDAGLITLDDVPPQYQARCKQYVETLRTYGLSTRVEWIERTTAVRADQVSAPTPVAGTLDRIFQLPNGELVIGDLKTSSSIEYGWVEIAVQLALYAHGVNTHGLFDWNTKTWEHYAPKVRTDYAIVVHLPADGDGCFIYRVDLNKGWAYAQVSGQVQSRQKDKSVSAPLTPIEVGMQPALTGSVADHPAVSPHMARALELVGHCQVTDQLGTLYGYAVDSGLFSPEELTQLKAACASRWSELNIPH
jgi:DNA (cytosine-5)-methyltransferase 1